jgi:hypothetical protein
MDPQPVASDQPDVKKQSASDPELDVAIGSTAGLALVRIRFLSESLLKHIPVSDPASTKWAHPDFQSALGLLIGGTSQLLEKSCKLPPSVVELHKSAVSASGALHRLALANEDMELTGKQTAAAQTAFDRATSTWKAGYTYGYSGSSYIYSQTSASAFPELLRTQCDLTVAKTANQFARSVRQQCMIDGAQSLISLMHAALQLRNDVDLPAE